MVMEDFICGYDNILDDETIDRLITMIDNTVDYNVNYKNINTSTYRQDKQITIEPFWPDLAIQINNDLMNRALIPYVNKFPYLSSLTKWTNGCVILQKTSPSEGYHEWHCENTGYYEVSRAVVWMIYLNDVEEGGETEFLYQRKRMIPKRNTALLWPGSWTHLHRGNPPLRSDKYILTGWFVPITGMRQYTIGENYK